MRPLSENARTFWKDGDPLLLFLCLSANLFGLLLIYSATRYSSALGQAVWKQLSALLFGLLFYVILSFVNAERLVKRLFWPLLFLSLALLLLLIPFGNDDSSGNRNWISLPAFSFQFQPAEFVKVSFILLLAFQLQQQQERGISHPLSLFKLSALFGVLAAPLLLVSRDMGMLLVYGALFLLMLFAAGVHWGWFAAFLAAGGAAAYLLWPRLPAYIQMRVLVVLDHELDPQGKGFQQLRSLLAIGSGERGGQGFLQGIQTQSSASSALPARHTDFIFSVAGEEFGLWGALLILALLCAIILRCLWLSRHSQSLFFRYAAAGCAGMLAVQTVFNVGMCLFLLPVVGLTLPFFSYGGSSLLSLYLAMGLLSGMKRQAIPAWRRDARLYAKPREGV